MKRRDVLGDGKANPPGSDAPIEWERIKVDILERIDVRAEYESLGLEFTTSGADARGTHECRSMDRTDDHPSAVVFDSSWSYYDSGSGEKALSFFDFALKYGSFKDFKAVIQHYATVAGLELGRVELFKGRFREATYHYRDADGNIRYAVFRYRMPDGRKAFTQHGADGNGGWRFDKHPMSGVEPLPYRLPEMLAAPGDPVWIVEGEKTAERLVSLGLLATTSHGGAGNTDKVWPKLHGYFRGRDCLVIPDNDAAGIKHGRKVCEYLSRSARSVRCVELPDVGPRGDTCDFLDRGHTLDELLEVARSAPPFDPDRPAPDPPADDRAPLPKDNDVRTVCLEDVVAVPIRWLWPERVAFGKITLFAGESKAGKSFLTMDLIARITAGLEMPGPSGGICFDPSSVVLLSAEDDIADTIKPRLVACGGIPSRVHVLEMVRRRDTGQMGMFDLSYVPSLEVALRRSGSRVVIIDPITHYLGSADDHKTAEVRGVMEPLREMSARLGIAAIVVTHLNKGTGTKAMNRVTGSNAYTALARSNFLVIKDKSIEDRRIFASAGTNLCKDPAALAYRIDAAAGRIAWEPGSFTLTADEAMEIHAGPGRLGALDESDRLEAAREWVRVQLPPGADPVQSDLLIGRGAAAGHRKADLWTLKKEGFIFARKNFGPEGGYAWFRPEGADDEPADLEPNFEHTLPIRPLED